MSCRCHRECSCPYPEWMHPLCCNPTRYCCAGYENGCTLVVHAIVLDSCGNQSCTPRNFTLRITGPSYPNGALFSLRAGSCAELDEPLVITGLTPGNYTIEQIFSTMNEYCATLTGPVCGNMVSLVENSPPTVVTIVNRKQFYRRCPRTRCCC